MKRIAIIGYGAIGRSIAAQLTVEPCRDLALVAVCVRPAQTAAAQTELGSGVRVTDDVRVLLADCPDIVVEAAGHEVVQRHAETVLAAGADFHVLSVGALADDRFRESLSQRLPDTRGRIVLPAGALGGFDALLSLRAGGLDTVTYISTKPPEAWRGTVAEDDFDLGALVEATVLLDASARQAAVRFPRNANLAAAVALAGIGFERTNVRLIADPAAGTNIGQVIAQGRFGRLDFALESAGTGANPKTSEVTAFSVVAGLRNAASAIAFH